MRLRVGIWPCPTTWAWNLSMALPMCDPLAERSTPLSEEASPPATHTRIVLCSLGVAYRAIPAGLRVLLARINSELCVRTVNYALLA